MKVLLIDIETAPHLATVWGLWQQNVATNQLLETGYVMCFAAAWYDSKTVEFDSVRRSGVKRMLRHAHSLLSKADAVVHYNGTKFDIPTLNKEFVVHGMKPPAPYKQIDLYHVARKTFRFASNKLDFVAQQLGVGSKHRHAGHQLWLDCMRNDDAAWAEMEKYNRQDIALLRAVYDRMLPWINSHPNYGLYDEPGVPVCVNCGSSDLQFRGWARTQVNKYRRFQCNKCGKWSRTASTELSRDDRALILRSDNG